MTVKYRVAIISDKNVSADIVIPLEDRKRILTVKFEGTVDKNFLVMLKKKLEESNVSSVDDAKKIIDEFIRKWKPIFL